MAQSRFRQDARLRRARRRRATSPFSVGGATGCTDSFRGRAPSPAAATRCDLVAEGGDAGKGRFGRRPCRSCRKASRLPPPRQFVRRGGARRRIQTAGPAKQNAPPSTVEHSRGRSKRPARRVGPRRHGTAAAPSPTIAGPGTGPAAGHRPHRRRPRRGPCQAGRADYRSRRRLHRRQTRFQARRALATLGIGRGHPLGKQRCADALWRPAFPPGLGGGDLYCRVSDKAEVSSILADCKKVALKDVGGKAHALASRGVMPLLALESDISAKRPAGTTCWSLVPYGKGWISDPKPVDLTQYRRRPVLAQLLRLLPEERDTRWPRPPRRPRATRSFPAFGRASAGGRFLIDDEGEKVAVDLVSSDTIRVLTGKLIRHDQSHRSEIARGNLRRGVCRGRTKEIYSRRDPDRQRRQSLAAPSSRIGPSGTAAENLTGKRR